MKNEFINFFNVDFWINITLMTMLICTCMLIYFRMQKRAEEKTNAKNKCEKSLFADILPETKELETAKYRVLEEMVEIAAWTELYDAAELVLINPNHNSFIRLYQAKKNTEKYVIL